MLCIWFLGNISALALSEVQRNRESVHGERKAARTPVSDGWGCPTSRRRPSVFFVASYSRPSLLSSMSSCPWPWRRDEQTSCVARSDGGKDEGLATYDGTDQCGVEVIPFWCQKSLPPLSLSLSSHTPALSLISFHRSARHGDSWRRLVRCTR